MQGNSACHRMSHTGSTWSISWGSSWSSQVANLTIHSPFRLPFHVSLCHTGSKCLTRACASEGSAPCQTMGRTQLFYPTHDLPLMSQSSKDSAYSTPLILPSLSACQYGPTKSWSLCNLCCTHWWTMLLKLIKLLHLFWCQVSLPFQVTLRPGFHRSIMGFRTSAAKWLMLNWGAKIAIAFLNILWSQTFSQHLI